MAPAIERRMTLRDQVTPTMNNINRSTMQYARTTRDLQRTSSAAWSSIKNQIIGVAAAWVSLRSASAALSLSEELVSTESRLNLINDGINTTAELQDKIFQSAQRTKSSYTDTAAVVSKLGLLAGGAFSSNEEILLFAEQMNKQFKIGGASITEQTSAMHQLTQAMASGRLQGDEFVAIMENAPLLGQAIAKEMGRDFGELKKLSSEGLITADIIKKALSNAAEETDARFANIPITISQMMVMAKNSLTKSFAPALTAINSGFAKAMNESFSVMEAQITVISQKLTTWADSGGVQNLVEWVRTAGGVVRDMAPAIGSVVFAFGLFKIAAVQAAFAQGGLNAMMAANPFGAVVMAIAIVIGAITVMRKNWELVQVTFMTVWNSVAASTENGVNGLISGANMVLSGFTYVAKSIGYVFSQMWNGVVSEAESAVGALLTPINAIRGALGQEVIKADFSGVKSTMEKPSFEKSAIIPDVKIGRFSENSIAELEAARKAKIDARKSDALAAAIENNAKAVAANTEATGANTGALNKKSSDLTGEEIADKLLPRLERFVYG